MSIARNIKDLHQRIKECALAFGRDPRAVNLIAVSKTQPAEKITEALRAGHRLFGENKVQEARARWQDLRAGYPDLKLHLIGPLQTNKVRDAVALFDCIETLDRPKLVSALAKEMKKQNRMLPCFIQVNTGEEKHKGGVVPSDLTGLLKMCREHALRIEGLMCIPPVDEPPALHFAFLAKLAAEHDLEQLSIGMSADFEKAIPLGATYVRIGTALFGARERA